MRENVALGLVIFGTLVGVVAGAFALASGVGILNALMVWSLVGTCTVLAAVVAAIHGENEGPIDTDWIG